MSRRYLLPWLLIATLATAAAQPTNSGPPIDPGLTADERAWVAAHPEVLVAFSESFPPYSQQAPDGRMVGIDLDYLDLIAGRTGLRFKIEIIKDWNEALAALKSGRIDLLTGLIRTPEREAFISFTEPYIYAPEVIVTRTDMPYILDAAQLHGLRVGKVRGFASELEGRLKENTPPHLLHEFENTNQVFEALSRGNIDATITDTVNAAYTIKSLHLTNLRLGSVIGSSGPTYLGVTRQKPLLTGIINKAIATITTEERKEIDERWIAVDLAPSKWLFAFKLAAGLSVVALVIFMLALFHNRRLAAELAERRRVQAQLEEAHRQLARISEEKSELLHMVAHDLRSPLTGFAMGVELLQTEAAPLSDSGREVLGQMSDSTETMRRMVDDLVDVHLIEAGRHDHQAEAVDSGALLREVVAAFTSRAAQKGIRLALSVPPDGAIVWTDRRALHRVVDNLVSNAVKYSPEHAEVTLRLLAENTTWRLLVRDQGPGVQPEERERIFQKYHRGSALPTGGEKSTGLGLWIVRRIVTALHGRVWCEAGPEGVGTVFVVELPVQAPPTP